MHAVIYKPAKNAMQSGPANSRPWRMVFEERGGKFIDPLMGWVGTNDTMPQLDLSFVTKEEAIAYAEHKKIPYTVREPQPHTVKPSSYADNFRYDRIKAW